MPRISEFAGKLLKPVAKENTRRAGTKGHNSLQIIFDKHKENGYKGLTYEKYIELGGRPNDLKWDVMHSNVSAS